MQVVFWPFTSLPSDRMWQLLHATAWWFVRGNRLSGWCGARPVGWQSTQKLGLLSRYWYAMPVTSDVAPSWLSASDVVFGWHWMQFVFAPPLDLSPESRSWQARHLILV